jgi:hypothetical protein
MMPNTPDELDDGPKNKLNLAGSKPPGGNDGLTPIVDALVKDPGKRRLAVVEFYGLYDKRNTDDDTHQIIVRWSRIEPLFDDDAEAARKLLEAARTARLDAEDEAAGRMPLRAIEGGNGS